MWGGGKRGQSTASSSSTQRPSIQIWLPEDYTEKVQALIEAEEEGNLRGGLERCFNGLREETSLLGPMGLREELNMVGDELIPLRFRQFEISVDNGIAPSRLIWILERLCAELNIVDDSVWTENAAILASLPPCCNGCDSYGHTQEECSDFDGRAGRQRAEQGFLPQTSHAHGTYRFRKLGLNRQLERVICINDTHWVVKKASGKHNNCLIDTMRQSPHPPDGIADYPEYLDLARRDLAAEFPRGQYRVIPADGPEDANFLEFLEHVRSVVRCRIWIRRACVLYVFVDLTSREWYL
jgi:hypothetical protein